MAKRPFSSTIAPRSALVASRHAPTASRLSAIDVSVEITDSQLAANSSSRAASEPRSSRCAIDRHRPSLSRPATARSRSAARRGRRTICRAFPWSSWRGGDRGHGELIALLDHQRKRCVEHVLLTRRQRLAAIDLQSCQQLLPYPEKIERSVPYVTVRRKSDSSALSQGLWYSIRALRKASLSSRYQANFLQARSARTDRPRVPATIDARNCGPGGISAIVGTSRSRMNGSTAESDW